MRNFCNWDFQQPYHQAEAYSNWLSNEKGWTNEQLRSELPNVTAADIRSFFPQLLSQVHIELLAHGNLYKGEALKLTNIVERTLKPNKLPPAQWPIHRSLILPPGSNFVYRKNLEDVANVNHCIQYTLYVGNSYDRSLRVKLLLIAQMTEEPVFNQLRTKEQLGYIVLSGAMINNTWAGYRILIQSEKSPEYLEGRIDAFLAVFEKKLEEMPEGEFETHMRSLVNTYLERPGSLTQESIRFWNHIASESYDFEQADHDIAHLKLITKPELIEFFKQYVSPFSSVRAKLAVHMVAHHSPNSPLAALQEDHGLEVPVNINGEEFVQQGDGTTPIVIKDVNAWRAGLEVSSGIKLVKDLNNFKELCGGEGGADWRCFPRKGTTVPGLHDCVIAM